ncbi:hypothetical protein ACROYT_G009272 [Oculina patagonica]
MSTVFVCILWLCTYTQLILSSQTETKVCGIAKNSLESPGYPNNYPNATDCVYLAPIPPGKAMHVTFEDFVLDDPVDGQECRYDYLKIFNDQSQEYGVYCGERTGQTVLVTGKYVVITFRSGDIIQERGFRLLFTAVPVGITPTKLPASVCGSVVNNTLKSPGYPNDYPNVTDCIYVLLIPPGMAISIAFSDFVLEPPEDGQECDFDYLKITNENNDNFGKYCGTKTGTTVLVTAGHNAVLIFHSDYDIQEKGFLLFFIAFPQETSTPKAALPTTASNPSNRLSTLTIVVISVCGGVIAVLIGLAGSCYIWKKRRNRVLRIKNSNKVQEKNDKWEVKSDDVTICEELGQGAFGKVCKGIMKVSSLEKKASSKITVAVKMLQENATPEQKNDFFDEINLMKAVGSHKNIVSLIGCCIESSPNFLIVEYASKGDLLFYLRDKRKKVKDAKAAAYVDVRESPPPLIPPRSLNQKSTGSEYEIGASDIGEVNVAFSKTKYSTELRINGAKSLNDEEQEQDEDNDDSLTPQDMMSFSWQIAQGMVSEKKFNPAQQYLSGKNIIHRDLATRNVLVCDNKHVKVSDFGLARRTLEDNVYRTTGQHNRLPVKWMSPEAIKDGVFTTKSDVYRLMTRCWADNPDARPTFTGLCQVLEDWMQRDTPYLDLDQVDEEQPYYNLSAVSQSSGSSCE